MTVKSAPSPCYNPEMLRRWYMVSGLLLAACVTPTPASPEPTAVSPMAVGRTPAPIVTDTPHPPGKTLRLWMPPQFEPKPDTDSGAEFLNQLKQFEQANANTKIKVRVKRSSGAGGMIDSLLTGMSAAPDALPDIIVINARNLDAAAANGLIIELDELVTPDIKADYYKFAIESGSRNGIIMSLPFATDALVAAYATTAYKQSPTTWAAVLDSKYPVIFPAADPQSIYAVQQYLALGGTLQERSSVSVSISTTALTQLLDHYVAARTAGVLNNSTLDFASGPETWSAYQELRAPLVITNAHSYLQDASLATNTAAGAPPTLRGKPYTLAESWFYALISKDMTRESGAWELVDWLLQPENMGTWALKAGYLPPRTKAIESWPDEAPIDFALEILAAANERPDDDTLALIGPPLGKAVRNIIRGHVNTSAAVQDVIQEISTE